MFHYENRFVNSYIASLVVSILCSLHDHAKPYIILMKRKTLSRFSLRMLERLNRLKILVVVRGGVPCLYSRLVPIYQLKVTSED